MVNHNKRSIDMNKISKLSKDFIISNPSLLKLKAPDANYNYLDEENLGLSFADTNYEPDLEPIITYNPYPSSCKINPANKNDNSEQNEEENITLSEGETIAEEFGSTGYGEGHAPSEINFVSIFNSLQKYNNGASFSNSSTEFLNIINEGLANAGIDPNSNEAKAYIKALITVIENKNRDANQITSNGIVLNIYSLEALDTNGDGSFMSELQELALSDEVIIQARGNIANETIQNELDSNNNNLIDINELQNAADDGNEFARLFLNENGRIDRILFLALGLNQSQYDGNGLIIEYFIRCFDKNNDGQITQEDIDIIRNSNEYKSFNPKKL